MILLKKSLLGNKIDEAGNETVEVSDRGQFWRHGGMGGNPKVFCQEDPP